MEVDGSSEEDKDAERKCEGTREVVKGWFQVGVLGFLEYEEGHIPVCSNLYTIRQGMSVQSRDSTGNQKEPIAHIAFTIEDGRAIPIANLVNDSLVQTKMDRSLNTEMDAWIFSKLSTMKKASRSRFASFYKFS